MEDKHRCTTIPGLGPTTRGTYALCLSPRMSGGASYTIEYAGHTYPLRCMITRYDQAVSRLFGFGEDRYDIHQFIGKKKGISDRCFGHSGYMFILEYVAKDHHAGSDYNHIPTRAVAAADSVSTRLQGTIWGVSVYCRLDAATAATHPMFVPDCRQAIKLVRSWAFRDPIRCSFSLRRVGPRWIPVDRIIELDQLTSAITYATGGTVSLVPPSRLILGPSARDDPRVVPHGDVVCSMLLPGMARYCSDVLPGMAGYCSDGLPGMVLYCTSTYA